MLEQRRAKEKGYITLREAAELANYTPDYVGQLIRAGKIKGEQVYSNVAWVTTEEEVFSYLSNNRRVVDSATDSNLLSQIIFKYFLYSCIAVIAVAILLLQYILFVSIDAKFDAFYLSGAVTETRDS